MTAARRYVGDETHAERRKRIIAENLGATLDDLDWSVKKFHHELIRAGLDISIQAVYRWLSGETTPSVDHQVAVAKVLHQRHVDLFPGVAPEVA